MFAILCVRSKLRDNVGAIYKLDGYGFVYENVRHVCMFMASGRAPMSTS